MQTLLYIGKINEHTITTNLNMSAKSTKKEFTNEAAFLMMANPPERDLKLRAVRAAFGPSIENYTEALCVEQLNDPARSPSIVINNDFVQGYILKMITNYKIREHQYPISPQEAGNILMLILNNKHQALNLEECLFDAREMLDFQETADLMAVFAEVLITYFQYTPENYQLLKKNGFEVVETTRFTEMQDQA